MEKLSEELRRLKNSKRNWCHAFFLLISLSFLLVGIVNYNSDFINEDAFCKEKIEQNFPEYQFLEISYASYLEDTCLGELANKKEQRDGLLLQEKSEKEAMSFIITDEADKRYLASDDKRLAFWIFSILGAIIFLITLLSWSGFLEDDEDD